VTAACGFLTVFIKIVVFPFACIGQLQDLPPSEFRALDRLRTSGIIVTDTAPRCTFRSNAVVRVRWCDDGEYHVVGMNVCGDVPANTLESAIVELPQLKRLTINPTNARVASRLPSSLPSGAVVD
jgi:hypothetical protein